MAPKTLKSHQSNTNVMQASIIRREFNDMRVCLTNEPSRAFACHTEELFEYCRSSEISREFYLVDDDPLFKDDELRGIRRDIEHRN